MCLSIKLYKKQNSDFSQIQSKTTQISQILTFDNLRVDESLDYLTQEGSLCKGGVGGAELSQSCLSELMPGPDSGEPAEVCEDGRGGAACELGRT